MQQPLLGDAQTRAECGRWCQHRRQETGERWRRGKGEGVGEADGVAETLQWERGERMEERATVGVEARMLEGGAVVGNLNFPNQEA